MEPQRKIEIRYLSTGERPERPLPAFLVLWAINTLSLWLAGILFPGSLGFSGLAVLAASGLLLSIANAVIRPVMLILTLPITLVSFGLFIFVVNGLVLLLVAGLMPGFSVSGFWAGVGIALFLSLFRFLVIRLLAPR
jgi:putative membrane protein